MNSIKNRDGASSAHLGEAPALDLRKKEAPQATVSEVMDKEKGHDYWRIDVC